MLKSTIRQISIIAATAASLTLLLLIVEPQQPLVALAAGVLCGLAVEETSDGRRGRLRV